MRQMQCNGLNILKSNRKKCLVVLYPQNYAGRGYAGSTKNLQIALNTQIQSLLKSPLKSSHTTILAKFSYPKKKPGIEKV